MNKKILAIISVILTLSMMFGFAGCQSNGEEETTITAKTPLSTENPTLTYSPEDQEINTGDIFAYFETQSKELQKTKAAVKISLSKGITKAKDANDEDKPYSDNDTINAVIKTLSSYMLITDPTKEDKDINKFSAYLGTQNGQIVVLDKETEYGEVPLNKVLPLDQLANITRENVEKAICVDEGQIRTITITLKDAMPPEIVEQVYNHGLKLEDLKKAVLEELATADDYMKVVEPENIEIEYDNCQLIVTVNLETDEITAIEYVKRANISAKVVGAGTLAGLKETPVNFCYESFLKYELDRNDPNAVQE